MNRIFYYLILPLISLIGLGLLLNHYNFDFIDQYVIACGPILAAFVALFISKNSEHLANEKEFDKRETTVEHLYTLLNESEKVLVKEIANYTNFSDHLSTQGMRNVYLKTTPFYFLEEISKQNHGELYDSIVKRTNAKPNELRRLYLDCIKQIESSIFLKNNAESQYRQFIESYNGYASQWRDGQLALNSLHADITTSPSGNHVFDTGFLQIVFNYNQGIQNGTISFFSINDIRTNLLNPLVQHLQTNFFQHYYVSKLQQTLKIIEVSLDKMEEVQNMTKDHFDYLRDELEVINKKLVDNKESLNKTLQTTIDMT